MTLVRKVHMTLENAQEMEKNGIVTFKGFSGKLTAAEIAFQAPQICQMHSNRGDVFDLAVANERMIATRV